MIRLALRNIIRKKTHTALTLASIICGVVGLILAGGWIHDIFVQLGEALIHSQSGHLQVYKQGYHTTGSRFPEKFLITAPESVDKDVAAVAGVNSVMARLNFSGLLNNGRTDMPIVGVGVEPNKENELGSFVQITQGRRLTDKDTFGIEVGHGLAQALKLAPGNSVNVVSNTLEGALNNLEFEIVGIFQSFSSDYDARAIKIPLAAAQELIANKAVNALVVSLAKTESTDTVASALKTSLGPAGMEVKTWVELNDFYEKTVDLYKRQFGMLQLIILFMVLLGVANSVNMSVFERVGEFGTMMSLGNRSGHVMRLILTEAVLLGLIGSTIGVVLGIILALAISAVGIPMPPPPNANIGYIARIQVLPTVVAMSFAIGLVATVLAAILPARRVSRTPIVDALRQNI